jgi:MoaA/NifB/PqqE/SkfB family radical SAM enzyme
MENKEIIELLKTNNAILHNILTLMIYQNAKEMQKQHQELFPEEKNEIKEFIDKVFVDAMKYKKRIMEITLDEHKKY